MLVLKTLGDAVLSYIKTTTKQKSLSVEQLRQVCDVLYKRMSTLYTVLESFDDLAMNNIRTKYYEVPDTGKFSAKPIFTRYINKLQGSAKTLETQVAFGAMKAAIRGYLSILTEISKHAQDVIQESSINIKDVRLSTIVLFGVLKEAEIVSKFGESLYRHFMDTALRKNPEIIKYRYDEMNESAEKVAELVTHMVAKSGRYSFMADINKMRQKNVDLVLHAKDSSFLDYINPRNIPVGVMNNITTGIIGFTFITWIVERFSDWKHLQYQRNLEFKHWAEQQAAYYRMKLTEESSPEQIARIEKILDAYTQKIIKIDSEIADYERSVRD